MPKRKTPQSRSKLFGRFDELDDDQFLELRTAVGSYFDSKFVEEETSDGDENHKTENSKGSGSDGGWVEKFFGA